MNSQAIPRGGGGVVAARKKRRYIQYRVTKVSGDMLGRVKEGDLTFDYWQGKSHTYTVYNLRTLNETGRYSVVSEGECTAEQYAQLAAKGRSVAAPEQKSEAQR